MVQSHPHNFAHVAVAVSFIISGFASVPLNDNLISFGKGIDSPDGKFSAPSLFLFEQKRIWNDQTRQYLYYALCGSKTQKFVMSKENVHRHFCKDVEEWDNIWLIHSSKINMNGHSPNNYFLNKDSKLKTCKTMNTFQEN